MQPHQKHQEHPGQRARLCLEGEAHSMGPGQELCPLHCPESEPSYGMGRQEDREAGSLEDLTPPTCSWKTAQEHTGCRWLGVHVHLCVCMWTCVHSHSMLKHTQLFLIIRQPHTRIILVIHYSDPKKTKKVSELSTKMHHTLRAFPQWGRMGHRMGEDISVPPALHPLPTPTPGLWQCLPGAPHFLPPAHLLPSFWAKSYSSYFLQQTRLDSVAEAPMGTPKHVSSG